MVLAAVAQTFRFKDCALFEELWSVLQKTQNGSETYSTDLLNVFHCNHVMLIIVFHILHLLLMKLSLLCLKDK